MPLEESPIQTWDKRFKSRHYSYRDNHTVTLQVLNTAQALALAALDLAAAPVVTSGATLYVFGTNARAISNQNWPDAVADAAERRNQCYGNDILLYSLVAAHVRLISVNPRYLRQVTQQSYHNQPPSLANLIFETEIPLIAAQPRRVFPTYGYGIIFRADVAVGVLNIDIEGNVGGGE